MEPSAYETSMASAEKTYRAIGRFMFEFSQLEYSLRHYLGEEIELKEQFFDAIMNYEVRTLCMAFESVFVVSRPEMSSEVHKLIVKCLSLNDERNRVAHGLWVAHREGGALHHVSRQKFKSSWSVEQAEALEKRADEASELRGTVEDIFWKMDLFPNRK